MKTLAWVRWAIVLFSVIVGMALQAWITQRQEAAKFKLTPGKYYAAIYDSKGTLLLKNLSIATTVQVEGIMMTVANPSK